MIVIVALATGGLGIVFAPIFWIGMTIHAIIAEPRTSSPLTESYRRCSQCGASIQSAANFCLACGAAVPKSVPRPRENRRVLAMLLLFIFIGFIVYAVNTARRRPAQQTSEATPSPAPPAETTKTISTPVEADASVTAPAAPATYQVIGISRGDYLNVREGAGSNYPIVAKLEPGTSGIVFGTKRVANGATTWQEISIHGHSGWVNADYIARESQTAPESPSPAESPALTGDLGVTSEDIQKVLEAEPFGVVFETSTPVKGEPRLMGKTKDGLAVIELIGPPTRLTMVDCLLGQPSGSTTVAIQHAAILLTLLKKTLPAWDNSAKWLNTSLKEVLATGEVRTRFRQAEIRLTYLKSLSSVTLSISSPSSSASPGTP